MRRIPFGGQPDGVLGNLRQATEAEIARQGGQTPLLLPARFPHSISDVTEIIKDVTRGDLGLTVGDTVHFWQRLLVLLTSCEARRFGEWEQQSWWDFSGANSRSPAYQRFLADGLTRTLVAARAREMSARTGGYILLQLLFDIGVPGRSADRLLNGPTNDVWIDPWVDHLRSLGVDLRFGTRVEAIDCSAGRITSVRARGPDGRTIESARRLVRGGAARRAHGPIDHPGYQGGRPDPGPPQAAPYPVDERDRLLPASTTSPSSMAT